MNDQRAPGGTRGAATTQRKGAEALLRESEEKYRSLFEKMGQGYSLNEVVRDADGKAIDLRYLELNPAFERLTGAPLSEAVGRLASEVFPGLDGYWVEICDRAVATGIIESVEHELTPNGRWYRSSFYPIGNDRILSLYDDITEQKRAEKALRESEERQAFLLRFTDAVRSESSEHAVVEHAVRMLAEKLALDRCYATRLYPAEDLTEVIHEVHNPGLTPMPSKLRNWGFPEAYRQTFDGTLIFEDVANDPALTEADRSALAAMSFGAFLSRPLRRDGSPVFSMGAVSAHSRRWTATEIGLVEEATERTWEAMERARTDKALRESEARLADELQSAQVLQSLSSQLIKDGSGYPFFERILDAAMTIMHADFGSMQMLDEKENVLRLIVWRNFHPKAAEYWKTVSVSTGTTCGSALRHGERAIVADIAKDDHLRGTESLRCYELSGIKAVQSTPLTTRDGRVIGMVSTHWREVHVPQEGELRLFDILARQAADFLERAAADEALKEREADLSRVQRIGRVGGIDIDVTGGLVGRRSPEYLRLHGIGPDSAVEEHEQWLARVHPEDREHADRALLDALGGTADIYESEYRIIRPSDGELRWIQARADIERDAGGKPTRMVGAHLDVTERKQAEEALRASERHANVLLAELQHRVRNTLAVVRSIARRTAENSEDVEGMLAHFQGRLDAFSRVQAAVTRHPEGLVDLKSLIEDELIAHAAREGEQVHIKGDDVRLDPKIAERMSLAVHELTTNAVKHGALTSEKGRVDIRWNKERANGSESLLLRWIESGVDHASRKARRDGFGMELLRESLPYDLHAETEIDLRPEGLRFELKLPLSPDKQSRN